MTSRRAILAVAMIGLCAAPARAEIVFFTTGRNVSVQSHRVEDDTIVLQMRGGGEMTCEVSLIDRIEPDEVPYPEPVAAEPQTENRTVPSAATGIRLETNPRFDPIIQKIAREQGVDPALVRAVIQVESGYEPRARSPKGAVGLMQVMPDTARQYGVKLRSLYDPHTNIEAGSRYLRSLLDRLPLNLALAAYNAGETAVQRFSGVPPYPETQKYVSTVLALLVK